MFESQSASIRYSLTDTTTDANSEGERKKIDAHRLLYSSPHHRQSTLRVPPFNC